MSRTPCLRAILRVNGVRYGVFDPHGTSLGPVREYEFEAPHFTLTKETDDRDETHVPAPGRPRPA